MANREACELLIEQEIESGLRDGKTPYSIGKEISAWVEKLFEVVIKPTTIEKRAERQRDDFPTFVGKDSRPETIPDSYKPEPPAQTLGDAVSKLTANKGGAREGAGRPAHVSYNSGENEWYTPPEYIEAARKVMGSIDLDPASSEVANRIVGATTFYTKADDGRDKKWTGRVYMNPPYASNLIGDFASKFAGHIRDGSITDGIVLVNNATETTWFQKLIECAQAVVFTTGRVRFLDPQGNPGAPLQGQAFIYFGGSPLMFLNEFRRFGWGATPQ